MTIDKKILEQAYSYQSYKELIDALLLDNRTTGSNQSESYIGYTKMSQSRMRKWDKIGKIDAQLFHAVQSIKKSMTWLVITEAWCGDAGQILPFVNKMAELNPEINLKLILRDEHPVIMDQFLTNGARSIPKIIALSSQLEVLGSWGPRPMPIQTEFLENKVSQARTGKEFTEYMHLWYAKDKGRAIQSEFLAILEVWIQKLQSLPVQAG